MEENKSGRMFPIQNEAACALKWSWLTLYLSLDQINMCHRTGGFNLSPDDNFKDFNKHPKLVEERKRMVDGKWPKDSCQYCKRVEDSGGKSERQVFTPMNNWNPHEIMYSENNELQDEVTPTCVEVYFKNTCNLACTYCTPQFSSKIEAEIKKYGPASKYYSLDGNFSSSNRYEKRKGEFWEWMHEHSHKIKMFHILGGEPLYQKEEFEECLSFFEESENDNSNIGIKMFSNLMHKPRLFKQKLARIQKMIATGKIDNWIVVCSIDAWGPEQEYSRYGIDLEQWEENFNTLMELDGITVQVHSTICPLTTPTNWELRQKVLDYQLRYDKEIEQSWNIIQNPPFLDPTKFGSYVLPDLQKLIDLVNPDTKEFDMLTGYYKAIESNEPDLEMLREFVSYSDKMDQRRNLDWRAVYPELSAYVHGQIDND